MKPEGYGEIYRVAFDAANSELTEIAAEFDRLLARKEQLEKLVGVLQSVIPEAASAADAPGAVQQGEPSETPSEGSEGVEKGTEGVVADPFQRRIDHVLGIGAGIRDVRKYSRQF